MSRQSIHRVTNFIGKMAQYSKAKSATANWESVWLTRCNDEQNLRPSVLPVNYNRNLIRKIQVVYHRTHSHHSVLSAICVISSTVLRCAEIRAQNRTPFREPILQGSQITNEKMVPCRIFANTLLGKRKSCSTEAYNRIILDSHCTSEFVSD